MNIDQLRAKFANENVCRQFFESIIWRHGRVCPHCQGQKSYPIYPDTFTKSVFGGTIESQS